MKIIEYKFLSCEVNHGTEEEPNIEQVFLDKSIPYSEANEEIAKREAYGEPTIGDDGQPEPMTPVSEDDSVGWDAMADAIKEGVNEV